MKYYKSKVVKDSNSIMNAIKLHNYNFKLKNIKIHSIKSH